MERLTCGGRSVYEQVEREKRAEQARGLENWHYATIVSCSFALVVLVLIGAFLTRRRVLTNRLLRKKDWEIPIEDIVFYTTSKSSTTGRSR